MSDPIIPLGVPLTPLTGTWFPVDASGLTLELVGAVGTCKVVEDISFITAEFIYPTTADGNTAYIGGLTFLADATANFVLTCSSIAGGLSPYVVAGSDVIGFSVAGDINTLATNADLSEAQCRISGWYQRAQE